MRKGPNYFEMVPRTVCDHFREPVGEMVSCPACPGNVRVQLFGCAVHGRCQLQPTLTNIAACEGCKDKK